MTINFGKIIKIKGLDSLTPAILGRELSKELEKKQIPNTCFDSFEYNSLNPAISTVKTKTEILTPKEEAIVRDAVKRVIHTYFISNKRKKEKLPPLLAQFQTPSYLNGRKPLLPYQKEIIKQVERDFEKDTPEELFVDLATPIN
ncbi:MAG: hypothetical protein V2B14_03240 [bacterium]